MRRALLLLYCVGGAGCGADDTATILVELRTDFVPGIEIAAVRTELEDPARSDDRSALRGEDFVAGVRVAELADVPLGRRHVVVRLLDAAGAEVARRGVLLDVERDAGIVVVVTRDCAGVRCGVGETCAGGACVGEDCLDDRSEACGAECTSGADCPPMADCASALCLTGLCVFGPVPGACSASEYCDVASGCVELAPPPPLPDACVPAVEACNGVDDDCNGTADDVAGVGAPCGTDEGACTAGVQACGATGLECVGAVGGSGEACNGVDDDCDATVDETVCCPEGLSPIEIVIPPGTVCLTARRGPSTYADAEADCAATGAVLAEPRFFVARVCGTYWQRGDGITCWDGSSSFAGSCSAGGTVTTATCEFTCGAAVADCTSQYYYCQMDYVP